eukprot:TRINITY_DN2234_c0_g1_i1.p1 TRINITY_DN2234_c0_g1~~TRINITY_DN2234_c0_g1_i1.p1  ORF type:complete len:439 (-),score=126.73 TRINITY_DN2234_c0_g1_i1:725-2041(-)
MRAAVVRASGGTATFTRRVGLKRRLSARSELALEDDAYDAAPKYSSKDIRSGPGLSHFINRSASEPAAAGKSDCGGKVAPREDEDKLAKLMRQVALAEAAEAAHERQSMLVDTHGRFHNYLRISLTERCNLRCTYCMPEDGVSLQPQSHLLTTDEIARVAELFVRSGVDKVRLTGGEPLLRRDLADVVGRISALGVRHIGVTTNGLVLKQRIQALAAAGLSHVNVSLDTLQEQRFNAITRRRGLEQVLAGIDAALDAGFGGRLKINCVVMGGVNEDELAAFVELGSSRPLDVRFIEWMPFDDNRWNEGKFVGYSSMLRSLQASYPEMARSGDERNDTTKWYRVPGHEGRVGFITSMSEHFCGSCNRLRVMADGSLKVCLFDGDETLSLRDALRAGLPDRQLGALVHAAVLKKKAALGGHGDMQGIARSSNRPMILIGG